MEVTHIGSDSHLHTLFKVSKHSFNTRVNMRENFTLQNVMIETSNKVAGGTKVDKYPFETYQFPSSRLNPQSDFAVALKATGARLR